jgi:hypothetical protein
MNIEEIRNTKRKFVVENESKNMIYYPNDLPGYNIALPAQAIRVFIIEYVPFTKY